MTAVGNNLSNAFVTMFGDEVTHASQQMQSNLQSAVRTVRGVTGSTYKFPLLGKAGVIKNKTAHQDIEAMSAIDINTGSSGTLDLDSGTYVGDSTGATAAAVDVMNTLSKTATINTYSTGEYIDDFDALKTNVDLRSAYAQSIAGAMNRAYDKVIIDALDAGVSGEVLALEDDSGNNELTRATMVTIHKALNDKDVPLSDRWLVVSPAGYADILADTTMVSAAAGIHSDALRTGVINNVLGFNVIMSNLLTTVNTADKRGFAFHKNAVGCGVGKDITTLINYVPQKLSTLIAAEFSAGAVVIDPNGVASFGINA